MSQIRHGGAGPTGFFHSMAGQIALVAVFGVALSLVWPGATRWPTGWVIPAEFWVTDYITWLKGDASIFGVPFKDITRAFGEFLEAPVNWSDYLLVRGSDTLGLDQVPWVAVSAGMVILAHWVGGWRLAALALSTCLYLAFFHLWKDSMRTMTIVIAAVPMAVLIGLGLGVWVTRSKRAAAVFMPMFDLMQATPHLAYLPPVAALFSFGSVSALIATVVFAMPPMARCTILGLQSVSPEIVESGRMSGCTGRQLLWKVALPSAKRTLMLGVNQVVMQTFAMVVICSIVGASGLGQKLLYSLQQLKVGAAIEQGLAITLIAIVLDRITQAYADRPVDYELREKSWLARHRHAVIFLVILVVSYVVAEFYRPVELLPRKMTISFGGEMDSAIRAFNVAAFPYLNPVRDWVTVWILLPIRDFCLWLPWPTFVGAIAVAAWRLGGWSVLILCVTLVMSFIVTGFWVEAMKTTYLVFVSTLLCLAIGIPIGIWCARSDPVAKIALSICDTLQTFPSFIYLIPAIMLFRVGDFANVVAIIPYATVPAIRYTYLGLKRIPPVTVEASIANGATRRQLLWKVQMPIALPEIMLGVNQTIMMALAMTAITALIGSTDLGQEVVRAISTQNFGRGILCGFFIAALGIVGDRLIGAWAAKRRAELGMG
ncbi:ABC transporter permease [Pikeienuella piscinae]|uniref:ABC transporter permease n=1 Tax=Pikeienuella piscinae TaxID=2748098 RepID=UPI001BA67C88|nr:ABC transporter permease subunit [Pikeienuella piscinae]